MQANKPRKLLSDITLRQHVLLPSSLLQQALTWMLSQVGVGYPMFAGGVPSFTGCALTGLLLPSIDVEPLMLTANPGQ
jgi:hypothetical protein